MVTNAERGKYTTPEGSRTWEYLATFFSTIVVLCMGGVGGWNSPSIIKLMAPDSPIPFTASDASTLAAIVATGYMIAPIINSYLIDKIGRKNVLLLSAIPLAISWAMIIVAKSITALFIARFIAGLSIGFCGSAIPLYLAEIAMTKTRGATGVLRTVMMNVGILFAFIVGPYLSIPALASFFLGLSIAFLCGFWFMPESPYFLAMAGRHEEAEEALEKLRGKSDVSEEMEIILSSFADRTKKQEKATIREMFVGRGNRKALVIVFFFVTTHHFGGYMTILAYGQLIFKEIGSVIPDHMANVAVGVVQLISSILTIVLVERWGRRPLIFLSGFFSGLCNGVIGAYFFAKEYIQLDVTDYSIVPFLAILVLVFAFSCGLASLEMVIVSEVFPPKLKGIGSCLVAVMSGSLATVSMKMYLLIAVAWGYGHSVPFLFFCATVWVATTILLCITPETKGKTFVEIQRALNE